MKMNRLGRTDVRVSEACLGTMTFGQQNTEAEGHAQMDRALAAGINFFDTAEMYPIPPMATTQGRTEAIIGSWFRARGTRDKVVLATKVLGRAAIGWPRDSAPMTKPDRAQIFEAVEKSLRRLQTDYIDLYQVHFPDRPMRPFGVPAAGRAEPDEVPIEETLGALGELVTAGKVRMVGVSNESPWGVMRYLHLAETAGLPRIVSIQNAYSLLARSFESGLAEVALREDVGLLAYSPLAQGYLTGKYENGALPEGSRKALFDRLQRYEGPGADTAISAYVALAREHGLDPAQMALAWMRHKPFVTSIIFGATTLDQLETAKGAFSLELPEEVLKAIDAIHRRQPNPAL
ncbi:MAG: NADP(H)-dependent aldo-keto reductase [Alphaproteobacteria bacterium]|nr:NADP(H)-dependent aldo-keto reductase [Alphaproteobacteria bacterium]